MRVYEFIENIIGWIACLIMAVILLLGAVAGFLRTRKWKNPYKFETSLEESIACGLIKRREDYRLRGK